jgi:hypothetical protein
VRERIEKDIRGNTAARHSLVDEARSHLGLGLAHVGRSEQELAVQVRDVDRVHVDHINAAEACTFFLSI